MTAMYTFGWDGYAMSTHASGYGLRKWNSRTSQVFLCTSWVATWVARHDRYGQSYEYKCYVHTLLSIAGSKGTCPSTRKTHEADAYTRTHTHAYTRIHTRHSKHIINEPVVERKSKNHGMCRVTSRHTQHAQHERASGSLRHTQQGNTLRPRGKKLGCWPVDE